MQGDEERERERERDGAKCSLQKSPEQWETFAMHTRLLLKQTTHKPALSTN